MRTRALVRSILDPCLILTLVLLAPGHLLAGKSQVGDSHGNKPTPKEGSRVRVRFNPTVSMTVLPGSTLDTFMARFAIALNQAGAGDYLVTYSPSASELELLRSDGSEIDDLYFRENDPGIQSTAVIVEAPRLMAFLGFLTEDPSPTGGTLFVTLDDQVLALDTAGMQTATALNAALRAALEGAGYEVYLNPPYLVVRHGPGGGYFTRVGLRSTDTAIVTSDIGLGPDAVGSAPTPSGTVERKISSASRERPGAGGAR